MVKKKLKKGESISENPLFINYDNSFFKTKENWILSHPQIEVHPIKLSWPRDAIKTGKIIINDLDQKFEYNDSLYIRLSSDEENIYWSSNQSKLLKNKFRIQKILKLYLSSQEVKIKKLTH